MEREHYTKLPITRDPIDKTAALVTGKGWKGVDSIKRFGVQRWETCPPLKSRYDVKDIISRINNSLPVSDRKQDLTGKVFGRLTVMGIHEYKWSEKVAWIVRCSCGIFEPRKWKALLNPKHVQMCADCSHTLEIQKPDVLKRFSRKWK